MNTKATTTLTQNHFFKTPTLSNESPNKRLNKPIKNVTKKTTPEDNKKWWHSAFYGLAIGIFSAIFNFLPKKIGSFLSKIFTSIDKTKNPFIPE